MGELILVFMLLSQEFKNAVRVIFHFIFVFICRNQVLFDYIYQKLMKVEIVVLFFGAVVILC